MSYIFMVLGIHAMSQVYIASAFQLMHTSCKAVYCKDAHISGFNTKLMYIHVYAQYRVCVI